MLLLGIDLGTSSIKVSVVDATTQKCLVSAQYPESESPIISKRKGWAEQSPEQWWSDTQKAILKAHASNKYNPKDIAAIGIAYQMHGLVVVDKKQAVLRDSIIWCDSRAVETGNEAFENIGSEYCMSCLLNSPGNFTASKLGWVKKNEPQVYEKINKLMLPGDYIAMKLTGEITTTPSALSEGILWDFRKDQISEKVMDHFGFSNDLIPTVKPVFSEHGKLSKEIAESLSLKKDIPVSYKAGDQLNNALSLNVLEPGEVAATAGTSGVIYSVTDKLFHDAHSRVNPFVHVNHTSDQKRLGVLLCINGTGIMNKWMKEVAGENKTYPELNAMAAQVSPGSDGLLIFPFGNGAERIFENKIVNAHINNIELNKHTKSHLIRAAQEGIAFALRYGLEIMEEGSLKMNVIRAGKANMFQSDIFTTTLVNSSGVAVQLYENEGSVGAALGAGIGAGIYKQSSEAFRQFKPLKTVEPDNVKLFEGLYSEWKDQLNRYIKKG